MTLVYIACAWLLGTYLGSLIQLSPWALGMGALVCLLCALALRGRPQPQLGCVCLLALLLALWRYDLARPVLRPGALAQYNDNGWVALRGVVVDEAAPRDRWTNLRISVSEVRVESTWTAMHGLVLAQVPSYEVYRYGDKLELAGKLQTPPDLEGFSYRAYLARQGIHSIVRHPRVTVLSQNKGRALPALLYALKRRTQGVILAMLPEPEAALLTGILLGSDEGIPQPLMEQFRATGTAHIIAISGFNITLIAAALVKAFSRLFQRYVALAMAVVAIVLYTLLVGAEPPVVRAAIMGGLSALALIVGRRSHALTSLFAAAWAMTAWQPFTLWDIGFQLSFLSCLGLVLYAERLRGWCVRALTTIVSPATAERAGRLLQDTLLTTLAALVTTLPWMVVQFGQFSPLSLFSNALILPVQPMVMYLGSTAAIVGLFSLPLGRLVGWAAWCFLTYTIRVVEMTAAWIDVAGIAASIHPAVPLSYYALLAGLTVSPDWRSSAVAVLRRLLNSSIIRKTVTAGLLIAAVLVWVAVASLPDGRLHVKFLDVGQGDAILVQTPAGHRLLLDGGPSPAALLAALGRHLPFYDRRLDLLLLSHPHDDHLRGLLDVMERYQVRQVLVGTVPDAPSVHQQWLQQLDEQGIPVLVVQQPLRVEWGDGPVMEVFPPDPVSHESLDETSLVVRLCWQSACFLFTGDLEAEELLRLSAAGWPLSCTVLKVPHHGSAEAITEELLGVTAPQLAVISVGAENTFGHPAAQTLALLEAANVRTLRTDMHGAVDIATDGERYWVRASRDP